MRHKIHRFFTIILCAFPALIYAQQQENNIICEEDSLMMRGQNNYSSGFFRDRVLHNMFESFIDNYNDFMIYQTTTHGDFNVPDQTVTSLQGNSYRWNKYYMNNFRIDDQVQPGSYLYNQDLYSTSFNIDLYSSAFEFTSDKHIGNSVLMRYNVGGIGGVTPATVKFYNHFHNTALQAYFHHDDMEDNRRHVKGEGVVMLDYNIKHKDQTLHQHLYLDFGERELINFDYAAHLTPFYESYVKAELTGDLPTNNDGFFNALKYATAYSFRDKMNNEFYYGENETAVSNKYSASVYGNKFGNDYALTTGLTFVLHSIKHNDINFNRNHMDIDGESFEPFSPDANTFEFSHNLNFHKELAPHFTLNAETYNSLIYNSPTTNHFTNNIYFKSLVDPTDDSDREEDDPFYTSLYHYEWESKTFATGLLENTVGFSYEKELTKSLTWQSSVNATFDGMLIKDKSIVRPNWEGDIFLNWHPSKFFAIGLNVSRKRVPFHYDMAKYLSNDYMNRDIYFWNDQNKDQAYQDGEKGGFFQSTGGEFRRLDDNIRQPSYFIIDLPIIVKLSEKHVFTVETSYRKYGNQWQTEFEGNAEDYGYYVNTPNLDGYVDAYLFNEGQNVNYVINSHKPEAMQVGQDHAFFSNRPFAFVNICKYSYNGEKAFFSASWVSQLMINATNLGNSPQENNVEFYSDLGANPNTHINQMGRPQQDRGYIARFLYGYKFNEHWKGSFLFKFVDGQPFSRYNTELVTDANGNSQIATWRYEPNSISPLYDNWGKREHMGFNSELRIAYTAFIKNARVEFKVASYNLIDFAYQITANSFNVPTDSEHSSIEICAPRGLMFSTKISL